MSNSVNVSSLAVTLEQLQATFLSILPRIELHARIYFRDVKCHARKADCIQETIAIAWKWFVRLAEKGRDATRFVSALARYAACSVSSGRRVCGREPARDVLSPTAQFQHDFQVWKLPDVETYSDNPLVEALIDNTQSAVDEQVCFRLDFPAWLSTLGTRNRSIAEDMMVGHRTRDLAHAYRVTEPRISQLRLEFFHSWQLFTA